MSKISFLDNVNNGKNTKGSYFLTILITVIGGTIASISIPSPVHVIIFLKFQRRGNDWGNKYSK